MAATQGDIVLVPHTATLLTAANCTVFRAQIMKDVLVRFQATTGATAPTSFKGGIALFERGDTIPGSQTLTELFPGVTGAARIWAYSDEEVTVSFSHD